MENRRRSTGADEVRAELGMSPAPDSSKALMALRRRSLFEPATPRSPPGSLDAAGGMPHRAWVTSRPAAWRTAPSAVSFRLGELPKGHLVAEVWTPNPYPGWVAVEPRGYLQADDLVPADPAPCMPMPTPQKEAGKGTPTSAARKSVLDTPGRSAGEAADLLALRERGIRLRESNVALREEEFTAQRGLVELRKEQAAAAHELARLREEAAAERAELEKLRRRRGCVEEKLRRCCEAIGEAVDSVDRLYLVAEGEEVASDVTSAREGATTLGSKAADLLAELIAEEAAEEDASRDQNCAVPDYVESGKENENLPAQICAKKAAEEPPAGAAPRRQPFGARNV